MGKYDLVEEVLLSLGAEFFFTGALIQPGKPVVFGRLGEHYFFGLPGNPVSTMVTFLLFVEPLLGALCGDAGRAPRFAQARLASEVQVKTGLTRFLAGTAGGWQGGACHLARVGRPGEHQPLQLFPGGSSRPAGARCW